MSCTMHIVDPRTAAALQFAKAAEEGQHLSSLLQQCRHSRYADSGQYAAAWVVNQSVTEAVAVQAPASKQTTADTLQQPAEIVQLYRYPGLSKSAAATLLRKVAPTALPSPATAAQMAQTFISLL